MFEETSMAKAYLKRIPSKDDLKDFIDKITFTESELKIITGLYLEKKSAEAVANELGYSLQWVRKHHSNALFRVSNYIMSRNL